MLYMMENTRIVPERWDDFIAAAGAEQVPLYQDLGFRPVAYWETMPQQGYWPEVVGLWELDHFGAYAEACAREYGDGPLAERARAWERKLGGLATRSEGRLLLPSSGTPTLAEMLRSGQRAAMCVIETVHTEPGKGLEYVEQLQKIWTPVAVKFGRWMVGTYYAAGWRNREAINVWAAEDWANIPPGGMAGDVQAVASDAHTWVEMGLALRDNWDDRVVVGLPFSPLGSP
jgi:hypothetical protein